MTESCIINISETVNHLKNVDFVEQQYGGIMKERYTIRDVAALAGVSNATVSYVLSGKKKISEETRQRVL